MGVSTGSTRKHEGGPLRTYLSESLDSEAVDSDDEEDQDRDPSGRVDLGVPESIDRDAKRWDDESWDSTRR